MGFCTLKIDLCLFRHEKQSKRLLAVLALVYIACIHWKERHHSTILRTEQHGDDVLHLC